jgi:glycogen synthase
MHILLISSELPPDPGSGGIGTYVHHLAPALAARGHEVTVLSKAFDSGDTDEVTSDGVRVLRLVTREAPAGFWQAPFRSDHATAAKPFYDRAFTVATAFEQIPGLAEADMIESPEWAGEAALLRLVTDRPYSVRFHTPARLVFAWNGAGVSDTFVEALHNLERVAVENALGFTSPSRWMIPEVERVFAMPGGQIDAIPNPLRPDRPDQRVTPAVPTVLYLGRLEARKGILEAAPAMARVMTSVPDAIWRLAGSDTQSGPGGRLISQELISLLPAGVRDRVELLGGLDRAGVNRELASATAVLLPSRHENFPYACLEAMAAGAPVIASDRGGMAEMIEHDSSGVLVNPDQPDDIADALYRVLLQPMFAEQLSRNAMEAVGSRFAPDIVASQLEEHYRSLTSSVVVTA